MSKTLAATGHRSDKLGGYSNEAHNYLIKIAIDCLVEQSPEKIISGMALGWDMAWAEAGQTLNIPVVAAVPFLGQDEVWPPFSRIKYKNILSKCVDVIFVCDQGYAPWKMQIRNEYMVDHCDLLVALWNGSNGGTGNCIKYANKVNKPILNLWDKFNVKNLSN